MRYNTVYSREIIYEHCVTTFDNKNRVDVDVFHEIFHNPAIRRHKTM